MESRPTLSPTRDDRPHTTLGDPLPDPPPPGEEAPGRTRTPWRRRIQRWWIRRRHPKPPRPLLPARDQIQQLTVVHTGDLRDLVFLEPTLRALRLHLRGADRVLFAAEGAGDLLAGSGWGQVQPLATLAEARYTNPDDTLILDTGREAEYDRARLLARTGVPHRMGWDVEDRGVFYTLPLERPADSVHGIDAHLRMVSALGMPLAGDCPALPAGLDRFERGRSLWQADEFAAPVVLAPGWEGEAFGWPPEVFADIGARLRGRVVVMSMAGDETRGQELAARINAPHLHEMTMRARMDRLAAAGVVIGCDGGLVHLAAALGRPVICLTVNPHPWRTWPRSTADTVVYRGQNERGKMEFTRIDPSEIVAMALRVTLPEDQA